MGRPTGSVCRCDSAEEDPAGVYDIRLPQLGPEFQNNAQSPHSPPICFISRKEFHQVCSCFSCLVARRKPELTNITVLGHCSSGPQKDIKSKKAEVLCFTAAWSFIPSFPLAERIIYPGGSYTISLRTTPHIFDTDLAVICRRQRNRIVT